jgi:hypothetical protein
VAGAPGDVVFLVFVIASFGGRGGEADGGFCRTNSVGFVFEKWAGG